MSSFEEFRSQIGSKGLVRNNRFSIDFTIPSGLNGTGTNYKLGAKKALLFCSAANMPGMEYSTKPLRTTGEVRAMPYDRSFDGVSCTFILDNTGLVKGFFDDWMGIIQNRETRLWSFFNDYISPSLFIHSYDLKEKKVSSIELIDVWPKSISSIQLNFNDPSITTITVKFEYRYWKPVSTENSFQNIAGAGRGFVSPKDPFITLQGSLSAGEFLVDSPALPVLSEVSFLSKLSSDITSTASNLGSRVLGLEIDPSAPYDAARTSKNTTIGYFNDINGVMSGNTAILNTVSGLNISNAASTTIQNGLGVVRDLVSNVGTIASTIALFDKSGGAANVVRQLGNIQKQTESLRTNVFSLNAKINTTVIATTNAITQIGKIVAPNLPKEIK